MANKTKNVQAQLREAIAVAVDQDVIAPSDVLEWLIDNGWEHEIPTRPTVIAILEDCGVEYVSGYWVKVDDDE